MHMQYFVNTCPMNLLITTKVALTFFFFYSVHSILILAETGDIQRYIFNFMNYFRK